MDRPLTIEHGSNRFGRALRENRLRIALVVALVEGILVLVGEIPWWSSSCVAVVAVALYVCGRPEGRAARRSGRSRGSSRSPRSRSCSCPRWRSVLIAFAVVALVLVAVVALVVLLRDRR